MKKLLSLLAALLLILSIPIIQTKADPLPDVVLQDPWYKDERARVTVGNPTPMEGKFFTDLWGGSTNDVDARRFLHAASPVRWDTELNRFRFDRSVVEDAVIFTDNNGDRVYLLALNNSLLWSDGTYITAKDYAFSLLLQMDPAIEETGGKKQEIKGTCTRIIIHIPLAAAMRRERNVNMLRMPFRADAGSWDFRIIRRSFMMGISIRTGKK